MNKNYCQNPLCYAKTTQDRLRGVKGSKVYQNRVVPDNHYYYNCCTQSCLNDYLSIYMTRFIDYIGRLTETSTRPQGQEIEWSEYRDMLSRLRDNQ